MLKRQQTADVLYYESLIDQINKGDVHLMVVILNQLYKDSVFLY